MRNEGTHYGNISEHGSLHSAGDLPARDTSTRRSLEGSSQPLGLVASPRLTGARCGRLHSRRDVPSFVEFLGVIGQQDTCGSKRDQDQDQEEPFHGRFQGRAVSI